MTRSASPKGEPTIAIPSLRSLRLASPLPKRLEKSSRFFVALCAPVGARLRVTRSASPKGSQRSLFRRSAPYASRLPCQVVRVRMLGRFFFARVFTNGEEEPNSLLPKYLSKYLRKSQTNEITSRLSNRACRVPVFISSAYHMNVLSSIKTDDILRGGAIY